MEAIEYPDRFDGSPSAGRPSPGKAGHEARPSPRRETGWPRMNFRPSSNPDDYDPDEILCDRIDAGESVYCDVCGTEKIFQGGVWICEFCNSEILNREET